MGLLGEKLTKADLPPADTKRWTIRRKAQVVVAENGCLLTLDEACALYRVSTEGLALGNMRLTERASPYFG